MGRPMDVGAHGRSNSSAGSTSAEWQEELQQQSESSTWRVLAIEQDFRSTVVVGSWMCGISRSYLNPAPSTPGPLPLPQARKRHLLLLSL